MDMIFNISHARLLFLLLLIIQLLPITTSGLITALAIITVPAPILVRELIIALG